MTLMKNMTSPRIRDLKDKTVILPIGSIEQHGPHLPLGTDSMLVEAIAKSVAERCNMIVAPTLCYGVSSEHMDFPGTFTLKPETFTDMLFEVCSSLRAHGFKRQVILNYHGGNKRYIKKIMGKIERSGIDISLHGVLGRIGLFDHAGLVETSLMLHLFPELVIKEKIKNFEYTIPEKEDWKTWDYAKEGVIGDAFDATAASGKKFFDRIIDELCREIKK